MTDPTGGRANILKIFLLLTAGVSAAAQGGCTTEINKGMPAPVAHADRIGLFVPENAITNWDGAPGADGAVAQIMLFRDSASGLKSVLVSGEIDVMLYEGAKPERFVTETKSFFSWTFTAKELAQRVVGQYNALWGYSLRLQWTTAPRSSKVWLIARYRPPSGNAVYSSPAEQIMPVDTPKPE